MRIEITEEMREALARMRARDAEARDTQRTEGERHRNLTLVWWRDRVIPRGQVFRMRPEKSRRACPECGRGEAMC